MNNATEPPGTIVYTGKKKNKKIQIRYIEYNKSKLKHDDYLEHDFVVEENNENIIQWYDVAGLNNTNLIQKIGENFGMHPLVTEDIVDIYQRPSYTEFENSNFFSLKHLAYSNDKLKKEAVSIYFGKGYVLTFHECDDDLFESIRTRIQKGKGRIRIKKSDYLAYVLVDYLVDNYYSILDKFEDKIESLESRIAIETETVEKGEIFKIKKDILQFRKSIAPLREAINSFSRSDSEGIEEKTKIFVRDVYDHTIQIMDSIDSHRDILAGLQDLYLSEISMKMNKIMQFLTITTAIFVPLSFLTGLYGMNFKNIPELEYQNGYFVLIAVMFVITILMLWYFNKKKWF